MNYLYKNCSAIIYPSLFGPANIPLFEAWYLKKIILYPQQFSHFSKNGAILFDNENPQSLANSINNLKDFENNDSLVNEGCKIYLQYREHDKTFIEIFNKKLTFI